MKKKLNLAIILLLTMPLLLIACGKDGDSPKPQRSSSSHSSQSGSAANQRENPPIALSIKYSYEGKFGPYGIPDTALAFSGPTLLAKAKAIKIIKKDPGPNHILVEEFQFSPQGKEIYHGTLEFRFGFGGGTLVEEKALSGKKRFQIFTGWPSGS
jgi:hypothetical protein